MWMRRTYIIILLLCLFHFNVSAQYQITVLDKETKEPAAYANVYYPDLKTGVSASIEGVFTINTQRNSILVQISSVGYKTYLGTINLQEKNQTIYLEPSVHDLKEIVISDNASKLQGENVSNVESINLKNNDEIQGISLSQKLTNVAGISNLSTGAGIGKPVIRGLSGNRIAVFSQGVRLENQQWGDEHGLGLDENGYEQVEIIKGPASLLYGSDALGGVLYFTDERYAKENSIEAAINSEYNTNTNGWRNTGAFKLSKERFHWNVFGGYTTHEDYQDGNNNFVPNSRFRSSDFKTTFGYTGDKFVTSLKYSFLNEKYGLIDEEITDSDCIYANGRKPDYPFQNLTTHLISSENTLFFADESKLKVDIGYVFNNRKEFEKHSDEENAKEDDSEAALNMNLGTFSYNARWYLPKIKERWNLIVGSQGMYQDNTNKGEEVLIPDAATIDLGLFTTVDYYYARESYWQVGLRLDGRRIDGQQYGTENEEQYIPSFSKNYGAFNFSTGVLQYLAKELSLRANLSSGYRSPNMFELLSDGVHEGTNRYEIGNTNLNTENCYQIDASLNYGNEHLELYCSPYFNYIRNYIFLQPSDEIKEDLPVYYYTQADAYLYGGEAGCHFHPHPLDWLHLDVSYSNTFGQDKNHQDLPLIPPQKINATIRTSFSGKGFIKKFSIYAQNIYSFAQNHVADYETSTGSYNLVNAGLDFEFQLRKQKLLFHLGVNNLFNKTYYDHLSRYKQEGIYNIGRNINIHLTIPLEWKLKDQSVK